MKMQIQKSQQGFTLIELMIVVAIIGILASIAIPAYQDYVTRSKWAKVVAAVEPIKLAIGECLNDTQGATTSCDAVTGSELDKYGITAFPDPTQVEGVTITVTTGSKIHLVGTTALGGCTFDMTPNMPSGTGMILWTPVVSAGTNCAKFIKGAS